MDSTWIFTLKIIISAVRMLSKLPITNLDARGDYVYMSAFCLFAFSRMCHQIN